MPYYLAPIWKTSFTDLSDEALWDHYELCLKAHDWTYNFSDDHSVWKTGCEEDKHLKLVRQMCESMDKDRADNMFYKYSFFHNNDGTPKHF